MPNWKKVIVSGSNAVLNSLTVATNVVAQSFTGSLSGTAASASAASVFNISSSQYSAQGASAGVGTTTIVSISTGSFRAGFFDYVASSGGNARAGTVMSVWDGSSINFTDNSTTDIGSTTLVTMSVALSGANALLRATINGDTWDIKTTYRLI